MGLFADITLARRSFDLRVELALASEVVALVGPSGSGKTSLLRALAGLERPGAGHIALDHEVWLDTGEGIFLPPERRRLGYLPQDYALFPHLNVADNVGFASRRERSDLLARLGIGHLAAVRPAQLSGGERQRVALARALARDPKLLLLDEPFGALDAITRRQVRDELADLLSELELPVLLVTHAFDDAIALSNRIGVIERGRIVQLGAAAKLIQEPASPLVAALAGANVLEGTATPAATGSRVLLTGGGALASVSPASGPVTLAVHPAALELTEPSEGTLADTVVSVKPGQEGLVVRLSRLTVHVRSPERLRSSLAEGTAVGVRAAPGDVRVLPSQNPARPGGG